MVYFSAVTIHNLTLTSTTIGDPTSDAGKNWRATLGFLADRTDWSQLSWGRHVEQPHRVTLLINWNDAEAAKAFVEGPNARFAELATPLLAEPVSPPEITSIRPFVVAEPKIVGGGVSTIYRHTYSALSEEQRLRLASANIGCYCQILDQEREGEAEGFINSDYSWALDPETGKDGKTMYIVITWETLEAEEKCKKTIIAEEGVTVHDAVLEKAMFSRADPDSQRFHVEGWDSLTPDLMETWRTSNNPRWPYKPL